MWDGFRLSLVSWIKLNRGLVKVIGVSEDVWVWVVRDSLILELRFVGWEGVSYGNIWGNSGLDRRGFW